MVPREQVEPLGDAIKGHLRHKRRTLPATRDTIEQEFRHRRGGVDDTGRRTRRRWNTPRDRRAARRLLVPGAGRTSYDRPMTLTDRLTHDIADAMKAREQVRLSALRMAKAALMNASVSKGRELEESEGQQVLRRTDQAAPRFRSISYELRDERIWSTAKPLR